MGKIARYLGGIAAFCLIIVQFASYRPSRWMVSFAARASHSQLGWKESSDFFCPGRYSLRSSGYFFCTGVCRCSSS